MHGVPAPAGRPRFDIADIVRGHRAALEARQDLTTAQRRVLSAIARCRTIALGGHLDVCRSCGYQKPAYNSCRNRHCPKCQALAQERWIDARSERLLPVRHFHVVFTLPSELRPLAHFKPKAIFDALFHASSATLLELGRSRLGAQLGITMVLHTWTRALLFHPHVHAIVTAGGLALGADRWVDSSRRYLFPVEVMGILLRGKMIAELRRLHRRGAFQAFHDFEDPDAFERLIAAIAHRDWVVYAKKPFRRAEHVLEYLGRYTHRVGIANSRLLDVTHERVTFRTKNDHTTTISPLEFLRRFVQHVLPPHFVKIRHYGLLASSRVEHELEMARRLLLARGTATITRRPSSSLERIIASLGIHACPRCGHVLEHLPLAASARAPPRRAA